MDKNSSATTYGHVPGFRLFISGENFLPAKTAICRLGGKILAPAEAAIEVENEEFFTEKPWVFLKKTTGKFTAFEAQKKMEVDGSDDFVLFN